MKKGIVIGLVTTGATVLGVVGAKLIKKKVKKESE